MGAAAHGTDRIGAGAARPSSGEFAIALTPARRADPQVTNDVDSHSHLHDDAATVIRMAAMYVCICNGITDRQVREAAQAGASDLADLSAMTGCSTVCGSCGELALEILNESRQATFGLNLLAA